MCNLTPEVRNIYIKNNVEKRRNCSSSFPHYFVTCCHSFMLKQGPDFHFEISDNSNKRDNEVRLYFYIRAGFSGPLLSAYKINGYCNICR